MVYVVSLGAMPTGVYPPVDHLLGLCPALNTLELAPCLIAAATPDP